MFKKVIFAAMAAATLMGSTAQANNTDWSNWDWNVVNAALSQGFDPDGGSDFYQSLVEEYKREIWGISGKWGREVTRKRAAGHNWKIQQALAHVLALNFYDGSHKIYDHGEISNIIKDISYPCRDKIGTWMPDNAAVHYDRDRVYESEFQQCAMDQLKDNVPTAELSMQGYIQSEKAKQVIAHYNY